MNCSVAESDGGTDFATDLYESLSHCRKKQNLFGFGFSSSKDLWQEGTHSLGDGWEFEILISSLLPALDYSLAMRLSADRLFGFGFT